MIGQNEFIIFHKGHALCHRVYCRDIMHAGYTVRHQYARAIHDTFYNRNKKLVPRTLLSYISTWDFLRTIEKCEEHSPVGHASLALLWCC